MSQISFEEEPVVRRQLSAHSSSFESFVFKYSFGLVKSRQQLNILLILLSFLMCLGAFFNLQKNSTSSYPTQPSEDLINAVQPIGV